VVEDGEEEMAIPQKAAEATLIDSATPEAVMGNETEMAAPREAAASEEIQTATEFSETKMELVSEDKEDENNEGPSNEDLVARMTKIIKEGDMTILTPKKIRKLLEKHFDVSLKKRKKYITAMVWKLLEEFANNDSLDNLEGSDAANEEEMSPAKRQRL
jgi:hypothetical protein